MREIRILNGRPAAVVAVWRVRISHLKRRAVALTDARSGRYNGRLQSVRHAH
jgi:hypothetical protein